MTGDNQLPTSDTEGAQSGVWDFDKEYEARRATYDRALIDLRERLGRLIEDLERDGLFRAHLVPGRVKEADRIKKKAERDGIPLNNSLDVLKGIVGVRVVCNNLEDVDKVIPVEVREQARPILEHLLREGVPSAQDVLDSWDREASRNAE